MLQVGFEPPISAGERPQTHALDHWDQHNQCSSIRKMTTEMGSISENVGSFTPPDVAINLRKFYCKFRGFPHYLG